MASLTPKLEEFVRQYLVDMNATRAAVRAGYSSKTANRIASENLSKPDVQAAIADAQRLRSTRTRITQDGVVEALARIAFADLRRMFDGEGRLLPPSRFPDDVKDAVVSYDVLRSRGGREPVVRVRLADRLRALELLGRHLGMFRDLKPEPAQGLTIEVSKLATMSDEELHRCVRGLDRLIAATAGGAEASENRPL